MSRCLRCDFRSDPAEDSPADQLGQHALDTGHRLCTVCTRSLAEHDPAMACERCLTRTREQLASVLMLYTELPSHLGHARSQVYDRGRAGGSDGRPLPGGDVLVLLGGGSEGLAEDGETSRDSDVSSVAYELHWWQLDWQERRGDTPDPRPRSNRTIVHHASRYLDTRARWAAQQHPGFDEFASDVRRLHAALERATARVRTAAKANAQCFDCGGDLVRLVNEAGLEEDRVTCAQCHETYDPARYALALKAKVEEGSRLDVAGEVYATPAVVASTLDRTEQTIRNWLARGLLRREDRGGVVYVSVGDARAESDSRPRRARRSA